MGLFCFSVPRRSPKWTMTEWHTQTVWMRWWGGHRRIGSLKLELGGVAAFRRESTFIIDFHCFHFYSFVSSSSFFVSTNLMGFCRNPLDIWFARKLYEIWKKKNRRKKSFDAYWRWREKVHNWQRTDRRIDCNTFQKTFRWRQDIDKLNNFKLSVFAHSLANDSFKATTADAGLLFAVRFYEMVRKSKLLCSHASIPIPSPRIKIQHFIFRSLTLHSIRN